MLEENLKPGQAAKRKLLFNDPMNSKSERPHTVEASFKSQSRIGGASAKQRGAPSATTALAEAAAQKNNGRLDAGLLPKMDARRRADNYLSVGQTHLYDNRLLKEERATIELL